MKRISLATLLFLVASMAFASTPTITSDSSAFLNVDGKPFIIIGGELGNSSASNPEDIRKNFEKLSRMNLNTVLVPVYWDLLEREEDNFDFSLTDTVLAEARKNNLKVVFLWFGAWKNSMSCYAPHWVKEDFKRFPRAKTKEGKPLEIASAFSENVFKVDSKAFGEWLSHVEQADKAHETVIMVQIENEIGMLENARDFSKESTALYNKEVPAQLISYLRKNKKNLHPRMREKWESNGCRTSGSWAEVFGDDIFTEEIFMAWHYAQYVERMVLKGREISNLPFYVNAAMDSRGRRPGEYPSAGPLAHLIDVWRCAAPSLLLLAPDIYDDGFKNWVASYHRKGNPLFIPEMKLCGNSAVRATYAIGEHDALGVSPFSIEDASDSPDSDLARGYAMLRELTPLIISNHGSDNMRGILFDSNDLEKTLTFGDIAVKCRHFFTLPWDPRATDGSVWPEGGAIIIKLRENEFILAGSGIVAEFANLDELEADRKKTVQKLGEDGFALNGNSTESSKTQKWTAKRCGLASVDEIRIDPDGKFEFVRRHNGDQSHQGRHARISVGDWKILHIKLYQYE